MRYVLMPFQFAGTACAVALFGLGGVIFGLLITPVLKMTSKSPEEERRRARAVVRWWFGCFVTIITALRLVRVEVRNPEALMKEGAILACSHPSLIDVVCLLSVVPEATTIVKASLLKNIFTRAPIRAAGYVSNAEGPDAIEKLARELESGTAFVIFPEGTRTPSEFPEGEMPRLHRGAAQLALHTRRAVTPVRITASPRWLTKDRGWWHLPEKPMMLTFEALPEIPAAPYLDLYNATPRLAARRFTLALGRELFPGIRQPTSSDAP